MLRIETARLLLRPHDEADFEDLHALTAGEQMRRHLSGVANREESWKRLLFMAGGWAMFGYSNFAVIERDGGAYVGNCGVFKLVRELDPPFDGSPEAGWIIAGDRWGRGYASEAMAAAIDWFERAIGPQRLVCMISPGNAASEKVAARLGFEAEGLSTHFGDEVMRYGRESNRR
jgi:RimJ/RimL family protein N-acetyltransferase